MKKINFTVLAVIFLPYFGVLPLQGVNAQETGRLRPSININLIIDGSQAVAGVKEDISGWISSRFDQILLEGDRVTVWLAGERANIIYSGQITGDSDTEALKRAVRDIPAGHLESENADFSGALLEASKLRGAPFSYTLLISAAPGALSNILTGPDANLLRFSRVEEFRGWRALVIAYNLEPRIKAAAAALF